MLFEPFLRERAVCRHLLRFDGKVLTLGQKHVFEIREIIGFAYARRRSRLRVRRGRNSLARRRIGIGIEAYGRRFERARAFTSSPYTALSSCVSVSR